MPDPITRRHALGYRAIAARTALAGGALSVFTSGAMLLWQSGLEGRNVDSALFFVCWSAVCALTLATAPSLLCGDAGGPSKPATSPEVKMAIRSITPSLLAGASIGACLTLTTGLPLLPAVFWLVFYGLALLSLVHFVPQSVVALGWAFLFSGIGAFFYSDV